MGTPSHTFSHLLTPSLTFSRGHHGLWRRHLTRGRYHCTWAYGGEPENMRARRRVSSNTIHAGAARGSARLGFELCELVVSYLLFICSGLRWLGVGVAWGCSCSP